MPRITRMQREESNTEVKAGDKEALGTSTPAWHCRSFPSIALTRPESCSPFPPGRAAQQGQAPPAPWADFKGWWRRGARKEPPARVKCKHLPSGVCSRHGKTCIFTLLLLSSPKARPSLLSHTATSSPSLHLHPSKQVLLHTTSAGGLTQLPLPARQSPGEPELCSFPAQEMLRIENKKA